MSARLGLVMGHMAVVAERARYLTRDGQEALRDGSIFRSRGVSLRLLLVSATIGQPDACRYESADFLMLFSRSWV